MGYRQRIYEYLRATAPAQVTNAELALRLGIPWHANAYRATRKLRQQGLIQAERRGRQWLFYCAEEGRRVKSFEPIAPDTLRYREGSRACQARWLVPLLATSEGRTWFLEALRCPVEATEGRKARVCHFHRPLRDIIAQDLERCNELSEESDGFIVFYNELFGLPDDCGIGRVWKSRRTGRLRLPGLGGKDGWNAALRRKHIGDKRLRRRAAEVHRLAAARVDAMLMTTSHIVLVLCSHGRSLKTEELAEQRMLGGLLERRLGKQYYLACVVDDVQQLGTMEICCVTWDQIEEWFRQKRHAIRIAD
jgi:hypothetical protein